MYEVLTNEKHNLSFLRNGFVIVKDFLQPSQIETLSKFYHEFGPDECRNAFTTFATNNYDYKKAVDEKIKEVFSKSFNTYISEKYSPFWGNFFTKPSQSPPMPLHADWQYANEPNSISFNIWVPLVDTSIENGAFGIVPKSHLVVNQIRGINLSHFYLSNGEKILEKIGKILILKKGEAIIYDHRLLHFSLPNKSMEQRLAATLVGTEKNNEIIHFAADYEGAPVYKYAFSGTEDVLKTPFKMRPSHLEPVEELGFITLKPLTIEDFNGIIA